MEFESEVTRLRSELRVNVGAYNKLQKERDELSKVLTKLLVANEVFLQIYKINEQNFYFRFKISGVERSV